MTAGEFAENDRDMTEGGKFADDKNGNLLREGTVPKFDVEGEKATTMTTTTNVATDNGFCELLRGRNPHVGTVGPPQERRVSRTTSDENMAHGRTSHATRRYAASPQIGHLRVTGGTETGATTLRRVADRRRNWIGLCDIG